MSGIMAAIAGGTQNIIYAAGLYKAGVGVETSPIDFSASSQTGAVSYDYTWTGYYRPASTGTVTLGLATNYTEYLTNYGPYNWSGGGYARAYLWLGNTAKSGYNTGNANITSNDNTATYSPSLVAGIYYPVRIQMQMYLPYDADYFGGFYDAYATGTFNFQQNGNTDVTNRIWYNTKTNGF